MTHMAPDASSNPEIGSSVVVGPHLTNYHDHGTGDSVLLLHGSGPGVSAWANWRLTIRDLSPDFRLIAPDQLGFGFTVSPDDQKFTKAAWVEHIVGFLDAMDLARVHVIGNSFGGAIALALASAYPKRVERLVLMGSVGVRFDITPGLDAVWGYTPSRENMYALMRVFAYDQELISDDLVEMRYAASARPGVQESFARMFPAPRQRWVDELAMPDDSLRRLEQRTLIVHGRDDRVIPLSSSLTLLDRIPDAQLHVFGQCGHWTQIEYADQFAALVRGFLTEA